MIMPRFSGQPSAAILRIIPIAGRSQIILSSMNAAQYIGATSATAMASDVHCRAVGEMGWVRQVSCTAARMREDQAVEAHEATVGELALAESRPNHCPGAVRQDR